MDTVKHHLALSYELPSKHPFVISSALHKGANNVIKYALLAWIDRPVLRLSRCAHLSDHQIIYYFFFLFWFGLFLSRWKRDGRQWNLGPTPPQDFPQLVARRAMERKKDFSIERILGDRWKSPSRETERTEIDVESTLCRSRQSSSRSSSCEEEEDNYPNISAEIDNRIAATDATFTATSVAASSWLHSNYGCPPFFNRGWFTQTIRPPFFTLQGCWFCYHSTWIAGLIVRFKH